MFRGKDGERLAMSALLRAVERIDPTLTQHGFRSTFRDYIGDRTDFPAELAEFALAHVKKGTEGAYRRATSIEKRRALMEAWARLSRCRRIRQRGDVYQAGIRQGHKTSLENPSVGAPRRAGVFSWAADSWCDNQLHNISDHSVEQACATQT